MKENELKNEEVVMLTEEDVDDIIDEVEQESKFKGFMNKAGAGIKKHGKKVAGVAALVAIGAIGYALGHKTGDHDSDYGYDDSDSISVNNDFSDENISSTEE